MLQLDGNSHVIYAEEEAAGTRLLIDGRTCLLQVNHFFFLDILLFLICLNFIIMISLIEFVWCLRMITIPQS